MTLLDILQQDHLLPLFTPTSFEDGKEKLSRLQAAGIRAVELTLRDPKTLEVFRNLRPLFPELRLGAGTLFHVADVEAFVDAGAEFIISPCLIPEIADWCNDHNLPYFPGAGSVREVWEAHQRGAAAVKLFPAEVLGPAFVRALQGPLPQVALLVTGGVQPTQQSVEPWLEAGALAVGLGSQLFVHPDTIEETARDLLSFVHQRERRA